MQLRAVLPFAAALLLSTGCTARGADVRPPTDQLFFPAGIDITADESFLFVTNANSELRYDSGTVAVVDLEVVSAMVDEWLASGEPLVDNGNCEDCCDVDVDSAHTMVCNEALAIRSEATVRIGSFATEVASQVLASGDLRLFMPVRGDPSITWMDFSVANVAIDCGGSGVFPRCDDDHRITQLRDDVDLNTLSNEPFGMYVDSANGYAMVSHLSQGAVSLIDAPPNGDAPVLTDALGGLFAVNPQTGALGAVGIAGRRPGSVYDLVYVTSRSEARVQMLYVYRGGDFPTLVPSQYFFLDRVLPSDDGRGIVFSEDGNRAHIVNRDPPMLLTIDTSLGADGFPKNELASSVEICAQASLVALADVGRGERAYVACFRDSQVWVVDPHGMVVDEIISVGRGAHAVAVAAERKLLFNLNFLEDTISVIDLTPGAASENRVVLQLGRTRQSGGE
jgi:DNA-binding beta-propeller fold protein YncE